MQSLNKFKIITVLIGDIVVLYLSLLITLSLRHLEPVTQSLWSAHWLPFTFVFVLWLLIFYINKLYDLGELKNNLAFYSNLFNSLIWSALIGFMFFYVFTTGISPKTVLIIEIFVFAILFILWRRLYNLMVSNDRFAENVLLIGNSADALKVAKEVNANPQMGQKVIGILALDDDDNIVSDEIEIFSVDSDLSNLVRSNNIRSVVINEKAKKYPNITNELYGTLKMHINVLDLPTFAERYTNKILINTIGQAWFLEHIKEGSKVLTDGGKRIMDIVIGSIVLLIAIPFLPFIYLIIKVDSKGPGFFMQQRTGKNGKKFMAVKFRTMFQNAETNGPQWARKDDPRVTRVGRIMRKTRIDEIPQLINVIRGEMSFVGPRPERPEFIEKLKVAIPFYESRLLVKPGITGWAQINFPYGASEQDALEKLQYDLYYIKNRSIALDVSIILKTIKTVLSGGGQ